MYSLFSPLNLSAATSLFFPLAVIFFAYLVRGIAGFGSALIAVPLLALVMPLTLVVPMVVLLDYLSSLTQGVSHRQYICWKDIWPLIPFSAAGVAYSLYIFTSSDTQHLAIGLGIFIILFGVYQLLPIQFGRADNWAALPTGFFGGFFGAMFGTGGPFYVIYLSLRQLEKVAFRATFATIFLIDGSMRLAGFALNSLYDYSAAAHLIALFPAAILGLFIGSRIYSTASKQDFLRIISVLLLGSGIALILKNL
jgi:uncharacterized membrane protein YfcA